MHREGFKELKRLADKFLFSLNNHNPLCLLYFSDLRNFLSELNKEARKWAKEENNIYLLRTIIILNASLRHLDLKDIKDISREQQVVIWEIINKDMSVVIRKERYRVIYKRLINSGFRIIPYPSPVE